MRALLVEDDPFHAKVIDGALRVPFPDMLMERFETEKAFRQGYNHKVKYDVIILDQMLPWTSDDDEDYDKPDPPTDGPLRAGTRCYERLGLGPQKNVVFFTNLDQSAVPSGVKYVRKKDDPMLEALIFAVRDIIRS